LDISIKSNKKHHKTVLYSKSNKNMGDFSLSLGDFLTETSGHPACLQNKMECLAILKPFICLTMI
jgi:hypothetical protein